jgi:hypothetical protein
MQTSEKFCLRWNDFQENVNTAFSDLRKDCDFTDVTLASEDGNQIEAHKVILSASSPFFQKLLKRNQHAHPLIYMRGMKSEDLLAIVDFLYYGKADIYQENLDTFLNIAEEFQLKGLNGKEDGERGEDGGNPQKKSYNTTVPRTETNRNSDIFETEISSQNNSFTSQTNSEDQIPLSAATALPKHEFSGDMKELDDKIESLKCRGENMLRHGAKKKESAYVCKVCGKEGQKPHIKTHIEAIHLEGISVPCNICVKTFKSRESLRMHNLRFHRDSK